MATIPLVRVVAAPSDGGRWPDLIRRELAGRDRLAEGAANTLFVVIGPRFAGAVGIHLTLMLKLAESHQVPIIPLLVDGARMPAPGDLPEGLATLAKREALTLDSESSLPATVTRALGDAVKERSATTGRAGGGDPGDSIFIAYRRDDSGYWTDLLAEALAERLTPRRVFFDVGSQRAGTDYQATIDEHLLRAAHVVVVIGHGFLEPGSDGTRRIDARGDLLRNEITTALQEGKHVHVVLAGGAEMPDRAALPRDIQALTDTDSVYALRSKRQASRIADELAKQLTPPTAGSTSSASSRVRTLLEPDEDSLVGGYRRQERRYAEHASAVIDDLGGYGWTQSAREWRGEPVVGPVHTLVNPGQAGYRFELHERAAAVVLQERSRSGRTAGLPTWVDRALFSISPRQPSASRTMRLPAELVEAAMNPAGFLDRRGRRRVKVKKHLRSEVYYGEPAAGSHRVDVGAVEAHQRTRRQIAAAGGLSTLLREAAWDFEAEPAFGVAFHPQGDELAVATGDGVLIVDAHAWEHRLRLPSPERWQALAYSRTGRLAAVSGRSRLTIWDSDRNLVVDRIRPPKVRPKRDAVASSLSWSWDGASVASCDGRRAWIYDPTAHAAHAWAFPVLKPVPLFDDHGAHFVGREKLLLVYGLGAFVCVLRPPTLEVVSVLERSPQKGVGLIADRTGAASGGLPPFGIHCAVPHPDGKQVAVGGSGGRLALFDRSTWKLLHSTAWFPPASRGFDAPLRRLAFSPDGRWLAAAASEQRLIVGAASDLTPRFQSPEAIGWFLGGGPDPQLAWSPDARLVAVNSRAGRVEVFALPE